jgi:hypothetical protein
MTFFDIAKPLAERGIPQIRLRPKTKIAFETDWPTRATTDLQTLQKWSEEMPDANAASVALAKLGGFWVFEVDRPNLHKEIEQQTGQTFPNTLVVRSSPGKGHFWFKHSELSIAMGNCQAKDDQGELWSARADARYAVSAGSEHPTSGRKYEIVSAAEVADTPPWLVQWCLSRKNAEEKITASTDGPKIPRGSHDITLTRIGGKLRQDGLEEEAIYSALVEVCEKRCENYGSDYREMARKIAHSVCRYEVKEPAPVIMGGVPLGQPAPQPEPIERPIVKAVPYPTFPDSKWLFSGCSMYEGFARPICEKNPSRRAEFMMLPALTILLNYVGTKVRIEYKGLIPSMYLVLVARKGRLFKSSSIQDAVEYLNHAGIVDYAHQGTRNAEGKSLIWTAGSPEGIGIEMSRTNCKNSILFFDELATLSKKASIEGSSLGQALSTMYESGLFANTVKSKKEQYSHQPKTYCASLIAATTDKNFVQTMSPIITSAQGNDERFVYIFQPEILPKSVPQVLVNTKDAAVITRQRIDKAVQKSVYSIDGDTTRLDHLSEINNRVEQRAEKWALALAIDIGRDSIDDDILERAYAIAKYELAVKRYLYVPETTTREGSIQAEIIQLLQRNGGAMLQRDLNRVLHPERHGTSLWRQVYVGLIQGGWIAEDGQGTKSSPKQVVLLRLPEEDE